MTEGNIETIVEIIKLLFQYAIRKIRMQQVLVILVLLTYGLGDALTSAMMMDARSLNGESNLIVSNIYATSGLAGLVAVKLLFSTALILAAFTIYWKSGGKSYWMVNGFLVSLILFGSMAMAANIQAALGYPFIAPTHILLIFFIFVFILVEAGDIMDNRIAKIHEAEASMKQYDWPNYNNMVK